MQPATVAGLLDAIAGAWGTTPDVEITLEANPTSVEAGRFRGYRAAGVNRVSLGVQALDDASLKSLGRLHTADEAMIAVRTAAAHFERYSFDLIYARPQQTPAAWARELAEAIARAAEHLSLYQLTIEPGTPFHGLAAAGKLVPPDEETARALYDVTQETCARAGLPAYEISNHARPGAQSRHNLLYWRYGEYAGIGPGAHGRLVTEAGRLGTVTERAPEAWLARVEAEGHGIVETEALSPADQGDEFLVMGLRLGEGIDPERYAALKGRPLDPARLAALLEDGLVARLPNGRLAATPRGAPVLNAVVAELAA
jgi:oxygen-independent coproporphyrinogen-3 oxidase